MSIAISSLKKDVLSAMKDGFNTFNKDNYSTYNGTVLVNKALAAEKFFLGPEVSMLDSTFTKYLNDNEMTFTGPMNEFIRLPYKSIWVEITERGKLPQVERMGFLAERMVGHDVISITPFLRMYVDRYGELSDNKNDTRCWFPADSIRLINLRGPFSMSDVSRMDALFNPEGETDKSKRRLVKMLSDQERHMLEVPLIGDHPSIMRQKQTLRRVSAIATSLLEIGLLVLSAKNIFYKKVIMDSKVNRRRAKKNKKLLYSYHTLVVRVQNVQHKSNGKGGGTREIALHRVKGVFATYTREKPLFGHLGPNNIGPIYKSEHLRGDIRNGNRTKDYCIKDAQ